MSPEERRERLAELLGELFDLIEPGRSSANRLSIGEQADRRRRRDRFVALGLDFARELVRAARSPTEKTT